MQHATLDRASPLRREHKGIARQLELISKKIGDSRISSNARWGELLDGFGVALRAHFANEERMLYQPLETKLSRSGLAAEMRRKHRLLHHDFAAFRRACEIYEATGSLPGDLELLFASFESGLSKHIEEEEKVVFWLADCKLHGF